MTGSDYIAAFLAHIGSRRVYTLTGGACAFMIDAVARHPDLDVVCVQHEQAAAMAADAVWRVSRRIGVTMATSGPGATNLITGIASSYFDSIPSLHITGQVNQNEMRSLHGAAVRQAGFQETKIVEMVRPITKYAVLVETPEQLPGALLDAYRQAVGGRMGPVLVDVPMDVQQAEVTAALPDLTAQAGGDGPDLEEVRAAVAATLHDAKRPVVLWGGGVAAGGSAADLAAWLCKTGLPFVASWAGLSAFDHAMPNFLGQIGVYGNRGANFVLQNADALLVLGSRLDNRQRSGNPANFARNAVVHAVDVDGEELRKFGGGRYKGSEIDLRHLAKVLPETVDRSRWDADWPDYTAEMKARFYGTETSSTARRLNTLSPYAVIRRLNEIVADDAIVAADTGAAVCWLHQAFAVKRHNLFTSGGNSPMGYALCAALAAKLEAPDKQVICYTGDGGLQVNIQELQTIKFLGLDVAIVVMNNGCYGIIKQFQDSYLGSRYTASEIGYSNPDFEKVARAYGLDYVRVERLEDITPDILGRGAILIDVILSEQTLIEPKLEMGRPINDQFPYLPDAEYVSANRFVDYPRPGSLSPIG